MNTINFDALFNQLKSGVETVAKNSLKDYEGQAKQDGEKALDDMKGNLQQWVQELETGDIDQEDFGDLMREEEGLSEMISLKQAGLAEVHIDQFRNNLINMVVSTLTGLIKV